jgi:hypothetical protein
MRRECGLFPAGPDSAGRGFPRLVALIACQPIRYELFAKSSVFVDKASVCPAPEMVNYLEELKPKKKARSRAD